VNGLHRVLIELPFAQGTSRCGVESDLGKPVTFSPQALGDQEAQDERFNVARQRQHGQQGRSVDYKLNALFSNDLIDQGRGLTIFEATDRPIDCLFARLGLFINRLGGRLVSIRVT
jgi:hypothetical protein